AKGAAGEPPEGGGPQGPPPTSVKAARAGHGHTPAPRQRRKATSGPPERLPDTGSAVARPPFRITPSAYPGAIHGHRHLLEETFTRPFVAPGGGSGGRPGGRERRWQTEAWLASPGRAPQLCSSWSPAMGPPGPPTPNRPGPNS